MKIPFFSRESWDIESVSPPWGDRPSIYEHILKNIRPGEPGLGEAGDLLPDTEIIEGGNQIRWASGARDGVIGHHVSHSEAKEITNQIVESFGHSLKVLLTNVRAHSTRCSWNTPLYPT